MISINYYKITSQQTAWSWSLWHNIKYDGCVTVEQSVFQSNNCFLKDSPANSSTLHPVHKEQLKISARLAIISVCKFTKPETQNIIGIYLYNSKYNNSLYLEFLEFISIASKREK